MDKTQQQRKSLPEDNKDQEPKTESVLPKPYRDSQRRTTSHQRYVIPWTRKAPSNPECDDTGKRKKQKMTRRARRKPSTLRSSWEEYAEEIAGVAATDPKAAIKLVKDKGCLRLPTHLSQCKRLYMTEKWGYLLPSMNTNFGLKGAITKSRKGTLVHDESYCHAIEMEGRLSRLIKILVALVDPNRFNAQDIIEYIKGKKKGDPKESILEAAFGIAALTGRFSSEFTIYEPFQFPKRAIAPVELMWRPRKSETNINPEHRYAAFLWVHPHASADAYKAIVNASHRIKKDNGIPFECRILRETFGKIRCIGCTALSSLTKALSLENLPDPDSKIQPQIVYMNSKDPRLRYLYTESSDPEEIEIVSNEPGKGTFVPLLKVQGEDSCEGHYPGLAVDRPLHKSSNRTDGKHCGEPHASKQLKLNSLEWAVAKSLWDEETRNWYKASTPRDHDCNEIRRIKNEQLVIDATSAEPDCGGNQGKSGIPEVPLLIKFLPSCRTLKGHREIEVICNRSATCAVWNSLLRQGCLPIGLEQLDYYRTANQRMSFPRDYVDTLAGQLWWKHSWKEWHENLGKKTKHHSPNFIALRYPFHDVSLPKRLQRLNNVNEIAKENELTVIRGKYYLKMLLPRWNDEPAEDRSVSSSPLTVAMQCRWKMWSRGQPSPGALICLPTDEDMDKWNKVMSLGKHGRRKMASMEGHDELDNWYGPLEPSGTNNDSRPSRQVLGFVTSSSRNPDVSCGEGIGFVLAKDFMTAAARHKTPVHAIRNRHRVLDGEKPQPSWEDEDSKDGEQQHGGRGFRHVAYVLIRDIGSHQYYPAILIACADS